MEFNITHVFKCQIAVRRGLLHELPEILAAINSHKILIITDKNLEKLWLPIVFSGLESNGLDAQIYVLDPGEDTKNIDTVRSVWSFALANGYTRGSIILGLGGGTVLDIAGFVSSTFKRGTKLILVPTTLLAQVDASIGGKNGVNLVSKNIIGTFYHPHLVIIDPITLNTLPENDYKSGLAEVVKYGLINENIYLLIRKNVKKLLSRNLQFLERIIEKCVIVKMRIVANDPMEIKGDRMILNLGHTIGHAIEAASNFRVSHGDAVAIGLIAEAIIGEELLGFGEKEELEMMMTSLGLPTRHNINPLKLIGFIKYDKKIWRNRFVFALPASIGDVRIVEDVPVSLVRKALEATRI